MRRYIQSLLLVFFSISIVGCADEAPLNGLKIEMVVLNYKGEETTVLSGESKTFSLALKATNYTDEATEITSFNACFLAQENQEFMKVYKKINGNTAVGRPFSDDLNCAAIATHPIPIPANGSIYLAKVNWFDNPNNSALDEGKYFTSTSININENNIKTYVEFIIK